MSNPTTPTGTVVTTKMARTYVAGQRELLVAERVQAMRLGKSDADLEKLNRAIVSQEMAEAALTAFLASGKSAFKAGVDAGFVPYSVTAENGGRRPSLLPGKK